MSQSGLMSERGLLTADLNHSCTIYMTEAALLSLAMCCQNVSTAAPRTSHCHSVTDICASMLVFIIALRRKFDPTNQAESH